MSEGSSVYIPSSQHSEVPAATRRLLTNVLWNGLNEAVAKGTILVANVYLARALAVDHFGTLVLAQSFTLYLWVLADLGTSMYAVREVAKSKQRTAEIASQILPIRIVSGLLIFLIYIMALSLVPGVSSVVRLTFIATGFYLVSFSCYTDWILRGLERFRLLSYGGIAVSLSYLLGLTFFVKKPGDIVLASLVWSCSHFLGAVTLWLIVRRVAIVDKLRFDAVRWIAHIRASSSFMFGGFLSATYAYLPVFLIAEFLTQRDLGLFSAPFRIVTCFVALGFYIASGCFPVLTDMYYNDKSSFRKVAYQLQNILLILGVVLGLIGIAFGEHINALLFGIDYADSGQIFTILALLIPISFVRYSYTAQLRASSYYKYQYIPFLVAIPLLLLLVLGLHFFTALSVTTACLAIVTADAFVLLSFIALSIVTYRRGSVSLGT